MQCYFAESPESHFATLEKAASQDAVGGQPQAIAGGTEGWDMALIKPSGRAGFRLPLEYLGRTDTGLVLRSTGTRGPSSDSIISRQSIQVRTHRLGLCPHPPAGPNSGTVNRDMGVWPMPSVCTGETPVSQDALIMAHLPGAYTR